MKFYYIESEEYQIVATGETKKKTKDLFMKLYLSLHKSGTLSDFERFDTWDDFHDYYGTSVDEYVLGEVYWRGARQFKDMADFSKLIHLCNEQKRLDTDDDFGSDEQVNIENALYDEAQRLALKENRADDLENFFRKTERALSGERAEWLMEFFNAKEQN